MMALTAATPFLRGWLQDEDCRWDIVAQSVDDRVDMERGITTGSKGNNRGDPRLAGICFRIRCYFLLCLF